MALTSLPIKSVGIIAFVLVAFGQASAATLTGKVVGVSDGDTITVLDAHHQQFKIRLSGIDAPEKKQPFRRVFTTVPASGGHQRHSSRAEMSY